MMEIDTLMMMLIITIIFLAYTIFSICIAKSVNKIGTNRLTVLAKVLLATVLLPWAIVAVILGCFKSIFIKKERENE